MFSTSDTIVAIATPPGRGGIGIVRVSGPEAQRDRLRWSHTPGRSRRDTPPSRPFWQKVALSARHDVRREMRSRPRRPQWCRRFRGADVGMQSIRSCDLFPGPAFYTGEDVVEISAHGSPVVLREIVAAAIDAGARLAEPGEFTLRAFLNGRIDLTQAEAVADLIDAVTPLQARAAFDQLNGTLTRAISGDRCGALRSDRAARGVGRFSR